VVLLMLILTLQIDVRIDCKQWWGELKMLPQYNAIAVVLIQMWCTIVVACPVVVFAQVEK
jgi:hypothetical protein